MPPAPRDPERSLALLWRTHEPPARGPRPRLDLDQVVSAAVALADEEGLEALSMKRLAQAVGVGTMTLYTYVPSKAELLDLMVDAVVGEASGPFERAQGWRAGLERLARALWDLFHRHPWLLRVPTTRPVLGPNVIAKYEHELRVVEGIGLDDVEMDAVVTLVNGHVEGVARRALEATQAELRTGETEEEWWEAHAPVLERHFDAERFPVAARVGSAAGQEHQAAYGPEHALEFGLARILDGVEALLTARR